MTAAVVFTELMAAWRWLLATRLMLWIFVLAVVTPGAVVAASELTTGPLPWLAWGPGLGLFPTGGLLFSYVGFRIAARDRPDGLGALKAIWTVSPSARFLAELVTLSVVAAVAAALVSGVVILLSLGTPASGQGIGAAADLWLMITLDYALLSAFGSAVGSRRHGPGGVALAVGAPIALALVSAVLSFGVLTSGTISTPVMLTSLVAMSPWTLLSGVGSSAWGFGGATSLFTAIAVLMATSTLALVFSGMRRRAVLGNVPLVWRAAVPAAPLLALGLAVLTVLQPGSPSPSPAVLASAAPAISAESINAHFSPSGMLSAIATVEPAAALAQLWLNPGLTVTTVLVGGHQVPFTRRGGFIRAFGIPATVQDTVTVQYGGELDEWGFAPGTEGPALVARAFSVSGGAYLPAGSWYPLVPPTKVQVGTPAVVEYRLRITSSYATVLTNLGVFGGQGRARSASTGVTLVAGHFIRTRTAGLSAWAGPAGTATIRGDGILGAPIRYLRATYHDLILRRGRPPLSVGVRADPSYGPAADFSLPGALVHSTGVAARNLNEVNLQFGDVPVGLLPLANPNPEPSGQKPWVETEARPNFLGGFLPFSFYPLDARDWNGSGQLALIFSQVSPHWTRIASFDRPWPENQRPADRVLVWLEHRWGLSDFIRGPFGRNQTGFHGLTSAQIVRFWGRFRTGLARGWPTERDIARWLSDVKTKAPSHV